MRRSLAVLASCLALAGPAAAQELDGLWQANRRYGPDIRGTLLITQTGAAWQAEIAGRKTPVDIAGDALSFEIADGKEGAFRGVLARSGGDITGHWISAPRVENGLSMASPVTLAK